MDIRAMRAEGEREGHNPWAATLEAFEDVEQRLADSEKERVELAARLDQVTADLAAQGKKLDEMAAALAKVSGSSAGSGS